MINGLPVVCGIYAITHVASRKVYVGSSVNMRRRMHVHLHNLRTGKHHSGHLQSAYDRDGSGAFEISVVELCASDDLVTREQFHLDATRAYDRRNGYNLCPAANRTAISEETHSKMFGRKVSPETRAKMSAANQGRRHTPETKAKIRALKQNITAETRAKMSAHRLGKPSLWKEKIAEAMRRPEVREKLRIAQTGKIASPETRAKKRAQMLGRPGRPHTDADRAKISAARTGKPLTEPQRAVIEANRLKNLGTRRSSESIAKQQAWRAKLSSEAKAALRSKCSEACFAREQRKRELKTRNS